MEWGWAIKRSAPHIGCDPTELLISANSRPWLHGVNGACAMWIFTKHGFFSAVCARQGSGGHHEPIDPTRIMVRARDRGHLDALKKRFPDWLGACAIQESTGADYAHRIFVDKATWCRVLEALADETDYDNFKSKVARHQGSAGAAYSHSLHDVWSVMHRLQE